MHRKSSDVGVRAAALFGALSLATWAGGCGQSEAGAPKPLTADQFVNRAASVPPDGGRAAGQPVERGGAIPYDNPGRTAEPLEAPSADPNPNPQQINPAVSDSVRSPYQSNGAAGSAIKPSISADSSLPRAPQSPTTTQIDLNTPPVASTKPAASDVAEGGPRAVDVGFVVMEVNSKPIYSDKILNALEKPLAAEAKKNKPAAFREIARQLIEQQVQLYKRDELEVAAADLALEPADKQLAQALTMQWRQQQITAAGGSIEMARAKAKADGWEFDDIVQQQYRLKLVQIFYQKRIFPRIFVPPADVRAYYERNKDKEFSKAGKLKFRVIRIDQKDPTFTSPGDAVDLAGKVAQRAKTEDFAKLANEINKDTRGGAVGPPEAGGWVEADSYRYENVEKAVAKLQPGQVTDVIQEEGRYLFIAKLEEVQNAKEQAFDDPQVQEKISQRLRSIQLNALREQHVRKLERESVTQRKDKKIDDLLDIVMRKYEQWAKAG